MASRPADQPGRGAVLAEYALLLALIFFVCVIAIGAVGVGVLALFERFPSL